MSKTSARTVNIHGRDYETVASRVDRFRAEFKDYTLASKIVTLDADQVVIEAQILDPSGRLIANGHAQEFRQASQINKTSYVENCETSAIGRALAAFGIGGSEFASANEVQNAIHQQKAGAINPTSGVLESYEKEHPDDMDFLRELAAELVDMVEGQGDVPRATNRLEDSRLDNEQTLALWALLAPNSKTRNQIKAERRSREASKVVTPLELAGQA